MSSHVSYRGVTVDMEAMRRENEKVPAMGNMRVNAKGDEISKGVVTRTADEIARANHRVQSTIVSTGLKGAPPADPTSSILPVEKKPAAPKPRVAKEIELPSGDIMIDDEKDAK